MKNPKRHSSPALLFSLFSLTLVGGCAQRAAAPPPPVPVARNNSPAEEEQNRSRDRHGGKRQAQDGRAQGPGSIATAQPASSAPLQPPSKERDELGILVKSEPLMQLADRKASAIGGANAVGYLQSAEIVATPPLPADIAGFDTESYAHRTDNAFTSVVDHPLSTFAADVDTASYSNVRRFLRDGLVPPPGAVRVEELVNYFRYDYDAPRGDRPFAASTEVAACPWEPSHRLLRVGIRAHEIPRDEMPPVNLVFLLDVSGSMSSPDKLPLVKQGMLMLVDQLREEDRVGITVYAGAAGVVLQPTSGANKGQIREAIETLQSGGSTNGAEGIRLAYDLAENAFAKGGVNRVILCTDGDFNVGVTSESELVKLIEEERGKGVFLTVLGFGTGNLKDTTMEMLADKGNGNYGYIDSAEEAQKVLVSEAGATLVTVAKDVKFQLEFNPAAVLSYRLVGYENRLLAAEDFNDDTKDAGEVGAGHVVTAFYEIVLKGQASKAGTVDPLRYQQQPTLTAAARSAELATVKIRYKEPDEDRSRLSAFPVVDEDQSLRGASADFRFAAAVASFGLLLRGSDAGVATWTQVIDMARATTEGDPLRLEFVQLAEAASKLVPQATHVAAR